MASIDFLNVEYAVAAAVVLATSLAGTIILFRKKNQTHSSSPDAAAPPPPPYGPTLVEYGKIALDKRTVEEQIGWIAEYGSIYLMKSPLPGLVPETCIVGDPQVAKELLITQTNMYRAPCNFAPRPPKLAKLVEDGEGYVITALPGNDEWKWRKNALLREFHQRRLLDPDRRLVAKMIQYSRDLCAQLEHAAADSENPTKMVELTTHVAVRTIFFFLFGRDDIIQFDSQRLRKSACDMVQFVVHRALNPLHPLLKYVPFSECRRRQKLKDAAWAYMDEIVQDELNVLLEEHKGTRDVHPDRSPGAAIPSLLQHEPKFYEQGLDKLLADIRIFIVGGFETTAHTLAFAFGLMAQDPAMGDAIAKEGQRAFKGTTDATITPENLSTVLDQCPSASYLFSEALRLFPPVPTLPGLCTKDICVTTTKGSKYSLSAGTQVLFSIFAMNRHLEHAAAGRIDACGTLVNLDRWKDNNDDGNKKPFSMSFSMGAHVCAGKNLAILEGHLFLLMVASQFRFRFPPPTTKVWFDEDVFLFPKDGMPLFVEKRQ